MISADASRAWTHSSAVPVLTSMRATLRELQPSDAADIMSVVGNDDVRCHLSSVPGSERACLTYIRWARRSRRSGRHISFGVVPRGSDRIVGVFQLWPLSAGFQTGEWGFVLHPAYWGTGLFSECGEAVIEFAFSRVGVRRLEARAAVANARGNGALQKLGAEREGVLRGCCDSSGPPIDHVMWAIRLGHWNRRPGFDRCS